MKDMLSTRYCCAYQIVEEMRLGLGPQRACQVVVDRLRNQVADCQAAFVAVVGESFYLWETFQCIDICIYKE